MARMTWAEIRAETFRMIGGVRYTGMDARIERWIKQAYYELALKFTHAELAWEETHVLSLGHSTLALPDGAFSVTSIAEMDANGLPELILTNKNDILRLGTFRPTAGQPTAYARTGRGSRSIQFNRKTDVARSYSISFYRFPEEPVVTAASATSPELHEYFDPVIVDLASVIGATALRNGELLAAVQARYEAAVSGQLVPGILEVIPTDLPETPLANTPKSGDRG